MKKIVCLTLLAFGISAMATDSNLQSSLQSLNTTVKELLQPIQDARTTATLTFNEIRTDDVRALSLDVAGHYKLVGDTNVLEVRMDKLAYNYGDGSAPLTTVTGFVGVDITKLVDQETLNSIIPELENMVQGFASSYTEEFGAAATVTAKVFDKQQDANGNFVSISAEVSLALDITKLPESRKPDSVIFKGIKAAFTADLKKGVTVDVRLNSNTSYKGFQENGSGLKQELENLLNQKPETMAQIKKLINDLNNFARRTIR